LTDKHTAKTDPSPLYCSLNYQIPKKLRQNILRW